MNRSHVLVAGVLACVVAAGVSGLSRANVGEVADLADAVRTDDAPSLTAAVQAAWRHAQFVEETRAMTARAQAQRDAANRPWASSPAVEVALRDDRLQSAAGRRETELSVAWPLWLPGQRSANEAAAQAALDGAQRSARVSLLHIAGRVRDVGWQLLGAVAERAAAAVEMDTLNDLSRDVQKRLEAGELARADALAARAEALAAQARLSEAELRLEEARIRWRELTGLPAEPTRRSLAETVDGGDPGLDHPVLDAAVQSVEHARRRLDLVRLSNREPPELKIGVRQDIPGGAQSPHSSLIVGVKLPLGTADRSRPREAAALADLEHARAAEARVRQRLAADIAAARAVLDAAERQLRRERERAELLRDRSRLIERSFRAGESSLPDLLRTLAAASQAQAAALRQEILLEHARARLQQAIGRQP